MKRDRPAYDEAEHLAHRPPPRSPAVPDVDPSQPSLFAETREYLEDAEARLAGLTPLARLQEDLERNGLARPGDVDAFVRAIDRHIVNPLSLSLSLSKLERGLGAVLQKNPPKGTVRNRDYGTSIDAALAVEPHLSALQARVMDAFAREGPMTDEQLEQLAEFRDYKYSTVRKRRTELVTKGALSACGKAWNSSGSAMMTLFDLALRVHGSAAELESRLKARLASADARDAEDVAGPDPEPLDCAFREEDENGLTLGERFNDSEATY